MKKKLEIGIGALDESAQRFVKTWRTIERRQALEHHEILTFDNIRAREIITSQNSRPDLGQIEPI